MDSFDAFCAAVLHEESCERERIETKRLAEIAQNAHRKAQEARTAAYAALLKQIKAGGS